MVLGACVQGFTKSLAMTVLSEVGDKTFFAAAVGLLPPIPLTSPALAPVLLLALPASACVRRCPVWLRRRAGCTPARYSAVCRRGVPLCSAVGWEVNRFGGQFAVARSRHEIVR
jgi:hypothetical protein